MSADTGLARFDARRAAQTNESSEQTDFRTIGAREHGQLALDELESESRASENQTSADTQTTAEPTHADFEAALGCARTTIDALREQVEELEAEREQLRRKGRDEANEEAD